MVTEPDPVDLSAVTADDEFLEHLTEHLDDELARILLGWIREVLADEPPR